MISVRRIMGIETEYALLDTANPGADPDRLASSLLYAYLAAVADDVEGVSAHIPSPTGRELLRGAGTRFDYSGEVPGADARGFTEVNLAPEARTDEVHGAALTSAATKWVIRLRDFEAHYYRGSASHGPNGARLYVDHTHPEYAAPEALGPTAAALYDRAGDALMHRAATALNAAQGTGAVVIKNNTDGKGAAWGAHESYLMDRSVPWDALTAVLIPFLVTRPVIGGSGRVGIGQNSEQPGFQIFARADFVEQEVSLYTTRERPIVNTRDEPHAAAGRWRRLHVITADSSTLAATSLLRLGSLAAVLSLVENHPERAARLAADYRLTDPVAALRTVSRDLRLTEQLPLAGGGAASALDVQRTYLRACEEHASGADEETSRVLATWREALDALENGPEDAAHLVEWCAKYRLLQRLRQKYGCGWDDPRIAAADLQFAMVDPAASLARRMERAGAAEKVFSDDEIARAEVEAPRDTRAGGRAALLAAFGDRVWAAGWTSVVVDIDRPHLLRVTLADPYHPTADEVERALAGNPTLEDVLVRLGAVIPEDPTTVSWDEGIYAPQEE